MTGKGTITGIILLLGLCFKALAGPADPTPVKMTLPDGSSAMVHLHGDEFFHWMTDESGQEVVIGRDGRLSRPRADAPSLEARRLQAREARAAAAAAHSDFSPNVGEVHFPVILVAFSDLGFVVDNPQATFDVHFNQKVRDYFVDNSGGKFTPVFDVFGPVTLPKKCSDYGGNSSTTIDRRCDEAFLTACQTAAGQGFDFSPFDQNGDGYIDDVICIYAGYNEAQGGPDYSIWPKFGSIEGYVGEDSDKNLLGSVRVDRYSCTSELQGSSGSEMCGIGLICHEFAHSLGLPDLYDTDGSTNGTAEQMYTFSLMANGEYNAHGQNPPYLCAVERNLLGWMDLPDEISGDVVSLESIRNGVALRIPTDNSGEYFILECRDGKGRDSDIGAEGLLIYHVDQSSNKVFLFSASFLWKNWLNYNMLNAYSSHPCCYAMATSTAGKAPGHIFPGSLGVTSFTAKSWSGANSDHIVENITFTGDKVVFTHNGLLYDAGINAIFNPGEGKYKAGGSFSLSLISNSNLPDSVDWYFDGTPVSGDKVSLPSGTHKVTAVLHFAGGREVLEQEINVK